jgi:hypothetical protein
LPFPQARLTLASTVTALMAGPTLAVAPASRAATTYALDRTLPASVVAPAGIASSTRIPGVLWALPGRGGGRVYAVSADGSLRSTVTILGARRTRWSDIESGPGHRLWVAGTGAVRRSVVVLRFAEPTAAGLRARMSVTPTRFAFRLPRASRGVEAMLVSPVTGRLLLVSRTGPGRPGVVLRAPARPSAVRTNRLNKVATVATGVTSGAWAPDGRSFVLSTGTRALVYPRVGAAPTAVALPSLRGPTAVAVSADSATMYVGGGATSSPVYRAPLPPAGGPLAPSPVHYPPDAPWSELTDGCVITARGIQTEPCGILVGGAYGGNSDATPWEDQLGRTLGVQRRYYTAGGVDSAVAFCKDALAHHRLPWISFKLPLSWPDMAAGKGDAWAAGLVSKLDALDGPVWLAFHHEPEGDGDILVWRGLQERLGPLVHRYSDNVAYSVVLTGWHQLYGNARYRLDNMMPRTKVDILGFDLYEKYGTLSSTGAVVTSWTDWANGYFKPLSSWAKAHDAAWGLAEVGYDDEAHAADPTWISDNVKLASQYGAQGWAYFNTTINNREGSDWALGTDGEQAAFKAGIAGTPALP